jgi:hypothetical protein
LAIGLGLLPLILLEIGLRVAGVGTGAHDAYAEFGGQVPAFERAGDRYRTAKAREPFLAPQSFAVEKPVNGRRIFCFGGSTVHGRPYGVATAFPKWMELELAHQEPNRVHEVVNVGGISYASFRIVPMVREVLTYQPDAIVVATGHNEFLEDRTYGQVKQRGWLRRRLDGLRLVSVGRSWLAKPEAKKSGEDSQAGKFKTRLDAVNGYASYRRDAIWQKQVIEQFRASLREVVRLCEKAGVPLVLVQLGSNLRDCPPFKSEHRADLSVADEQAWQKLFERGTELTEGDPRAALQAYEAAAAIDDEFALLNYRIAKVRDRLGAMDGLVAHYQKAKDKDICPLRMFEGQYWFFEELATDSQAMLVDARRVITEASPDGIPGFDWYLDHVHPTIGGHQKIARAVLAEMREAGLAFATDDLPGGERRKIRAAHFASLGPRYLKDGARRLQWLDGWARRAKLAAEVAPRDWSDQVRLGMRRLDFGAMEEAAAAIGKALELDARKARERLERHVVELQNQGRFSSSAWLSERLSAIR